MQQASIDYFEKNIRKLSNETFDIIFVHYELLFVL